MKITWNTLEFKPYIHTFEIWDWASSLDYKSWFLLPNPTFPILYIMIFLAEDRGVQHLISE